MTLFIDTNTLLHYQPIDQINWKEVVPGEQVTLAYSLVVIDELDKHKQNPRLSARARLVQNQFMHFRQAGEVSDDVKIITVPKPHSRVLTAMDLDTSQNDLWVLASVLEYQATHPEERVGILTSDVGMQLRAEVMNIPVIQLDEKYAITVESDEQKELKRVKQELNTLKNAIPKLEIQLPLKEREGYAITLSDFESYVETEMSKQKAQYPKLNTYKGYFIGSGMDAATKGEIISYNNQLDNYHEYYQKYLLERKGLYTEEMLTIELVLLLANKGSVPGRSIHIEFRFPEHVSVHAKKPSERFAEPNMPYPPTLGLLKPINFSYERQSYPYSQPDSKPAPRINVLTSGVTTVEMSVDSIKQEDLEVLYWLYVTFKDLENVRGFNIDYEIRADNVPSVVRGQLNVKVITA